VAKRGRGRPAAVDLRGGASVRAEMTGSGHLEKLQNAGGGSARGSGGGDYARGDSLGCGRRSSKQSLYI
jgi:hypothetical protein